VVRSIVTEQKEGIKQVDKLGSADEKLMITVNRPCVQEEFELEMQKWEGIGDGARSASIPREGTRLFHPAEGKEQNKAASTPFKRVTRFGHSGEIRQKTLDIPVLGVGEQMWAAKGSVTVNRGEERTLARFQT